MSMTLRQLRARLDESSWDGPDDVMIIVDNGNGSGYDLSEVYDNGNHIVLVGDRGKQGEE